MNRVIIITVVFFFSLIKSFSQDYVPTVQDIEQFYKTKTLIVLDENPLKEYNFIIKDVIKQEWTLTEYDFISIQEFEQKRFDPQYSFLVVTNVSFNSDKTLANYRFLHLMVGGDFFRVNEMPDIVSFPISYASVEEEFYIYKLSSIVRLMQEHVRMITDNHELISANMFKYFKDNMQEIKDKTLYLVADELDKNINTEKRIQKVYPYKFKIVTREEIQKAIEEKDENVVYLHKVGPEGTKLIARCYKVIIGAGAVPKLYYFDYHMIDDKKPDGLLEKDLENLAKGKKFMLL